MGWAALLLALAATGCQFVDGVAPSGGVSNVPNVGTLFPIGGVIWTYDVSDTVFNASDTAVMHRVIGSAVGAAGAVMNELFDLPPTARPLFSNQFGGFFVFTTSTQIPALILPYPTMAGAVSNPGPVSVTSTDSAITTPAGVFQTIVYVVNGNETFLIAPQLGIIRKEILTNGGSGPHRHAVYELIQLSQPQPDCC